MNPGTPKTIVKLLIPVLLGLGLAYCSGMVGGSHSGKVINSLT